MSESSLWSRYRDVDSAERPEEVLAFLDGYAALAPVRDLKRGVTEALELKPGDHVLDAGCGTGVDLLPMAEAVRPGGRVTGVDYSRLAVQEVNRRFAGETDVEGIAADVQDLPMENATVDACRADRTLQHLERPDAALAELHRVLRPDGRLVVLEVGMRLRAVDERRGDFVLEAMRDDGWATDQERRDALPLMLPLLLARAGFREVRPGVVEAATREPAVLEAFLDVRERAGAGTRLREKLEPVRVAARAGELVLTMRGFQFAARA